MKHYDDSRYIYEINSMLERCNDITLLQLIWQLLSMIIRKEDKA